MRSETSSGCGASAKSGRPRIIQAATTTNAINRLYMPRPPKHSRQSTLPQHRRIGLYTQIRLEKVSRTVSATKRSGHRKVSGEREPALPNRSRRFSALRRRIIEIVQPPSDTLRRHPTAQPEAQIDQASHSPPTRRYFLLSTSQRPPFFSRTYRYSVGMFLSLRVKTSARRGLGYVQSIRYSLFG